MSNFSPKIEDSSEKELMFSVNEHTPNFGALASDELTRRTIKNFEQIIKKEIKTNERLSKIFITFGFIQIIIAFFQFGFDIIKESRATIDWLGIIFLCILGYFMFILFKEIPENSKE